MLGHARALAERNVRALQGLVSTQMPLLGIEPSSILSFRDEYPDLVSDELLDAARHLAEHCYLVEDFLAAEARAGRLSPADFDQKPRNLFLHGHCHQKALVGVSGMAEALALPAGHQVSVLATGCCGMAGSFGYEEEHYALSMQIGEMVLFPAVRKLPADGLIAAPGTSCRHQIHDGTGKTARHPVEWLWESLQRKQTSGEATSRS
jgi:Fe-S oxidoreductase